MSFAIAIPLGGVQLKWPYIAEDIPLRESSKASVGPARSGKSIFFLFKLTQLFA